MSFNTEQLTALAATGVPEAKWLLNMRRQTVQRQDEQDRRWRNMAHGETQLKEQGKQPQTAQEHLDAMAHYGFHPVFTLSAAQRAQKMRFDQFASACGGFTTRDDYPAKDEPDAPTKCEKCSKEGAALRCSWCGEWYCSKTCFIKDMRNHKQVCDVAMDNMHCGMPPTPRPELWSAQQYAKVYGIKSHAAAAGSSSSSAAKHPAAKSSSSDAATTADSSSKSAATSSTAQQRKNSMGAFGDLGAAFEALAVAGGWGAQPVHEVKSKTQKRNAKRREKQKQERALAAAGAGGDVGAKDQSS